MDEGNGGFQNRDVRLVPNDLVGDLCVRTSGPPRRGVVPVSALATADSPRLTGEDEKHVRRLAEMESEAPSIIVHRQTMRVIDGMHRLRVAILKDERTIRVEFFDGSDHEAFIRSVELNGAHGLPLTMADGKAAASRILANQPEFSDRLIAKIVGLTGKTVAALRRSALDAPQPNIRRGEDGRAHPRDPGEGRSRAVSVIAQRPDASLREIAREANGQRQPGVAFGSANSLALGRREARTEYPARI